MKEIIDVILATIIFLVSLSPMIYYLLEAIEEEQEFFEQLERSEANAKH